jgi:hypothetical protein
MISSLNEAEVKTVAEFIYNQEEFKQTPEVWASIMGKKEGGICHYNLLLPGVYDAEYRAIATKNDFVQLGLLNVQYETQMRALVNAIAIHNKRQEDKSSNFLGFSIVDDLS